MSRIHTLAYGLVNAARHLAPAGSQPAAPRKIYCLRNNDLGDVIVITPLFEALRRRFPDAEILGGVGSWAADALRHNPFVSRITPCNGPWHNRFSTRGVFFASRAGLLRSARYLLFSPEARSLAAERCDIGIDILGSPEGAAWLMRGHIPYRVGVRGYAGGHRTFQSCLDFRPDDYVGRFALRFAELLGLPADQLPAVKPQLYLTPEEIAAGHACWTGPGQCRLVVGFTSGAGGGRAWPSGHFRELLRSLDHSGRWQITLVGSAADAAGGEALIEGLSSCVNWAGRTTLRETFSLVHSADAVVCNASMLMHVASAFERRTVVVLGPEYASAAAERQLWHCNPAAHILGKEPSRPEIATPAEVLALLQPA